MWLSWSRPLDLEMDGLQTLEVVRVAQKNDATAWDKPQLVMLVRPTSHFQDSTHHFLHQSRSSAAESVLLSSNA